MADREVIVRYDSDILGSDEFWRGSDVEKCRNIPARIIAAATLADGKPRKSGMWSTELAATQENKE